MHRKRLRCGDGAAAQPAKPRSKLEALMQQEQQAKAAKAEREKQAQQRQQAGSRCGDFHFRALSMCQHTIASSEGGAGEAGAAGRQQVQQHAGCSFVPPSACTSGLFALS